MSKLSAWACDERNWERNVPMTSKATPTGLQDDMYAGRLDGALLLETTDGLEVGQERLQ